MALVLAALLWELACSGTVFAAEIPVVAAAADLQYALDEVSRAFASASGRSVKLAAGSSGNFTRQIIQGAPFELFFSADEDYVRELARRSLTLDGGALYAIGRLALYVPKGSRVRADAEMNDLAAAAADGRLRRLAIANPEHAPYGRAARAALMRKGLWESLRSRLVLGENVSQAAQFALSGSVEAGLIAYSLAISERMARQGSLALVPQQWHAPLRQRMVLLRGAGETARRFYQFVQSPPAREILERYGFLLPAAGS
ncbi:MAG: molybdate ABC transporter substrate-binding protein [Betaproteobacteria bacterium]|nr:molybdate ABC transporter substrate-binding protein [Betaproteobacteria bacterium]